jgi:hypothetical protein
VPLHVPPITRLSRALRPTLLFPAQSVDLENRSISDQNTVQKSNVSGGDSDDRHEENEGSVNEFDAHSSKTKAE